MIPKMLSGVPWIEEGETVIVKGIWKGEVRSRGPACGPMMVYLVERTDGPFKPRWFLHCDVRRRFPLPSFN